MTDVRISSDDLYYLWHDDIYGDRVRVVTDTGSHKPVVVARATQETDSYGEAIEGEVYMVFTVDGQGYKVSGYADSYGSVDWDGPIREVKPTTKTIEVWE